MTKPVYTIPTMDEVAQLRGTNGRKLVSTFSGCGGSCLGFELAGFEVVYANEFIPAAAKTYEINHPGVPIDTRDIRKVTADHILEIAQAKPGEIDVLEGSPPCASFSTSGARSRHWSQEKAYSETRQRTDDLFFEFARIVEGVQPKVFVSENVVGLIRGVAKGYFKRILEAFEAAGYWTGAKVLNAKWLGVPQARERLIFVGVRRDIGIPPLHPQPLSYSYTVRDALGPDLRVEPVERETDMRYYANGKLWYELRPGEGHRKRFNLQRVHPDKPCPTLLQTDGAPGSASVMHPDECRKFSVAEAKRLASFPDDFKLVGTYTQKYERIGRAVPPLMMRAVAEVVRDELLG